MDQSYLNGNVDTLFKSLENFTQTEGIIGKPVTQGDKTFLPVVSITVGYGSGNATMKGQASGTSTTAGSSNSGTGALGLGAKLCTDAIIVIDSQNVFMLPVNSSAASGNLMDKIPQIISGMKSTGTPGGGATNQSNSTNASSQTQNTQNGNTKPVQNTTKY
jgi:uncharacterized spore protein YtfJ